MERGYESEKKVGLIPKVVVPGRMGPKEYAFLITDRRTILVLEKSSKAGLAGAIGGGIAAAVAQAAASRRTFDYEQAQPDTLASDAKNMWIPHNALQRLEVKKAFLGPTYRFNIQYKTNEGKNKKLKGQLIPPSELVKERKREGAGKKTIYQDYARKVQEVYQKALPPTTSAQLADWRI